jgi:hypothetical protein
MPRGKLDWEAMRLSGGIGTGMIAAGGLLYYATSTAPPGPSRSRSYTASQAVAKALPQKAQSKIAIGLSVAFMLFGVLLYGLAVKTVLEWYNSTDAVPERGQRQPRKKRPGQVPPATPAS